MSNQPPPTTKLSSSLAQLAALPNSSTQTLHQIKKIDIIIANQSANLSQSLVKTDKISTNFNKLINNTQKTGKNLLKVQPYAEMIDQELRVLEGCIKVLEENKNLTTET